MNIEHTKEHFKDHVLTEVFIRENLKVFDFRKPDTGIYAQRWIIDRGCLIVTGDCYDATYWWNSTGISLKFLAGCGLSYFIEKCTADKDGNNQKIYDANEAEKLMQEIATEHLLDCEIIDIEEGRWEKLDLTQRLELIKQITKKHLNLLEHEWNRFFYHERHSEAYDFMTANEFLFGQDAREHDIETYTATPYFHLAALRVAYEKYPEAF